MEMKNLDKTTNTTLHDTQEDLLYSDLYDFLKECTLCPRNCKVNRQNGRKGYCKESNELVVARAALHHWEEPCISGETGSGTIFFSGCAMGCVFCQNKNIANGTTGKTITVERLVDIFFELKAQGALNINLVTPSHYVIQIVDTIRRAKQRGFDLPIVYNCSGYEKKEMLQLLEGLVDIYLPDFKYYSDTVAMRYSKAKNYFEFASTALAEMVRQVGDPQFDEAGIMKRGIIVRHLQLPNHIDDSKKIIEYLYSTYGDKIYISIMNQFTPLSGLEQYPEINRKLTQTEYDELVDYAIDLGVDNGFIQEGETALESFIPEFDQTGV